MRIAKPILMVTTPVGLIGGFHEAYQLAGNLVWLMVAMVSVLTAFVVFLVRIARREQAGRALVDDAPARAGPAPVIAVARGEGDRATR